MDHTYENPATEELRKAKKEAEQGLQLKKVGALVDLRNLMCLPDFRKVVAKWYKACRVEEVLETSSQNGIFFHEGGRRIGKMMRDEMRGASPEMFDLMITEIEKGEKHG